MTPSPESAARNLSARLRSLLACFFSSLRVRGGTRSPRLRIVERQILGPRQALLLVEVDGVSLLIAISPEAQPAFFSLEGHSKSQSSEASTRGQSRSSSELIFAESLAEAASPLHASRRVS